MGRVTRLRAQSETGNALSLSRRAFLGAVAGVAGLMCGPTGVFAAGPNQADGSEQARYAAEQAIPFDQLKPETKAKVLSVVDRPSLFRRLPLQSQVAQAEG